MNSAENKETNKKEMRLLLLESNLEVYSEPLPGLQADSHVREEVGNVAGPVAGATVAALGFVDVFA